MLHTSNRRACLYDVKKEDDDVPLGLFQHSVARSPLPKEREELQHNFSHRKLFILLCEVMSVKLKKTVMLKLTEHDESLDKTLKAYSEGLNFVSKVVYENGRPISANNLQRICYPILRNKIGLKAQMACNVCRQVAGAYKSMKSSGEWKLSKFDARTMVLSYGREFSFKGEYLSITTLDGRKKYKLNNL